MGTLNLALLGGFEADIDGRRLNDLPTRKARALLAILASSSELRQPRDRVAAMLWERSAEEQARASLRQTLASVRKTLAEGGAEGALQADGSFMWLDDERCQVDIREFESLIASGQPDSLDAACRMYSGEFLVGLSLREESFEQWLLEQRRHFQELARRGFGDLLESYLEGGNHVRAAEVAACLLAIDPLQEHVHRALMKFHASNGNRSLALRQFETCRAMLREELDAEPDEATVALAESIRIQGAGPDSASGESATSGNRNGSDDTPEPPGSEPPVAFPGEIRPVTVLFARFTAAEDGDEPLEPEQHHLMAQAFQELATSVVLRYGGLVDNRIGDAVVALFGTPVAHGNDAERALRAAVDIRSSGGAITGATTNPPIIRVGVASGQVVIGAADVERGGYTITGNSVDIAQQLEHASGAGEVLATEAVIADAARFFESKSVPDVELRSRGRPLAVHRILALRETPRWVRPTRFVGRRVEMSQIQSVLDACRDPANAHIVFVRGEPGIGKTRLLEESAALAEEQGFACYRVLVFDFGTSKNEEVQRSLARGLLGLASNSGERERQRAADTAVNDGLTAIERRVFLNDLLDLPQPVALKSRFDAMDEHNRNQGKTDVLSDLVRHRSRQGPILIMVEDLHWADPPVIERLAVLTNSLSACKVVLMLTSRVEGDPLDQNWRTATREVPLVTIDLRPLREQDSAQLADDIGDAPEHFRRRCIERAQGNPLFLEQLLRESKGQEMDEVIPSSVQELALSRSDRLEGKDRDALRAASVLGQRFTVEALRHLVQDPGYDCSELIGHDLVRPDRDGYLFAHALIREAIHASLLSDTRKALHLNAAEWFASSDLILRASHLEAAADPRAPRAYVDAALQEFHAYRVERALQLVDKGLSIDSKDDRCRLLNLKGEILYHVGPITESLEAYRDALDANPGEADRCHALVGTAMGLRMVDDYGGAVAALDGAEPIAESLEDWEALSRVCITRANLAFWKGHTESCLPQALRALEYARRAKSVELEIHALGVMGDAHYAAGRMRSAHEKIVECVEAARRHGLGRVEVAHRCQTAGGTLQYMLELRSSLAEALDNLQIAAEVGSLRSEMQSCLSVTNAALFLGRLDEAREHVAKVLQLADRLGAVRTKARQKCYLGRILLAEGNRREACEVLEEGDRISRETGSGYTGPSILGLLARATDDPDRRHTALHEGEALLAQGAVGHNFIEFYEDAMEACLQCGDWKNAERYTDALEAYVGDEPLPLTDFLVARCRALIAFGRGQRDEDLIDELERLIGEAREVELMLPIPTMERALASV
jgi:DNA-binding SARP family transcriptional activator/tetratricopeptide (TPR) repeat protein